jgi:hypothetical protein
MHGRRAQRRASERPQSPGAARSGELCEPEHGEDGEDATLPEASTLASWLARWAEAVLKSAWSHSAGDWGDDGEGSGRRWFRERRLISLIFADWVPHDLISSGAFLGLGAGIRPEGLSHRRPRGLPKPCPLSSAGCTVITVFCL